MLCWYVQLFRTSLWDELSLVINFRNRNPVTRVLVGEQVIIGSDDGMSNMQRQTITGTNVELLPK